jgi:hypothetical protein
MSCDFYFVKSHKFANDSTTTKAREKITTDLESLKNYNIFDAGLAKLETNQILLDKISHHRFERITRYNLGLASAGNSLETVGSYANNS